MYMDTNPNQIGFKKKFVTDQCIIICVKRSLIHIDHLT